MTSTRTRNSIALAFSLIACADEAPSPQARGGDETGPGANPTGFELRVLDAGEPAHGHEGLMGKPTAKAKSGLYSMKGPRDATPQLSRNFDPEMAARQGGVLGIMQQQGGQFVASPYGGAFAVGSESGGALGLGTVGVIGKGGGGMGSGYGRGIIGPTHAPFFEQTLPTEEFAHVEEEGFVEVATRALSTFSIDVDTASYSNLRRFIHDGVLPPRDAVRVEEMLNYFDYDYPQPQGEVPFSITTEVADTPWNGETKLLHVGIQGQDVELSQTPPRNLVFLIDVSGSMSSRLHLLKVGLSMLVEQMRPEDKISIVVYAGASGMVLPPTSGKHRQDIMDALRKLRSGGSTNGGAGIQLAYEVAQREFIEGGINRVILATDGDFNVGVTGRGALQELIESKREDGVFLSVLGFGRGNTKDATMELLADEGNGNYAYIDSAKEAEKVLVREAGSTLVTIAKDVKLQLEFNPAVVSSYRLIGYDNRRLAAQDFNDDTKDAGEIGAGHGVTALYELHLAPATELEPAIDPLKYQSERQLSTAAKSGEALTIKVRYKEPDGERSRLISQSVSEMGGAWTSASDDYRFAAGVALFGKWLRDGDQRKDADFILARRMAEGALGQDPHGDRAGFLALLESAARLAPTPGSE
jgi:Ca-activated chloride channel family protein